MLLFFVTFYSLFYVSAFVLVGLDGELLTKPVGEGVKGLSLALSPLNDIN